MGVLKLVESFIKNREALELGYIPKDIIARKKQIDNLSSCVFSPLAQKDKAGNLLIVGMKGTGKTATFLSCADDFKRFNISTAQLLYCDCNKYRTPTSFFGFLAHTLDTSVSPLGKHIPYYIDDIEKSLKHNPRNLFIILDEADRLTDINDVVYSLLKLSEDLMSSKTGHSTLSMAVISNRLDIDERLDEATRDRFGFGRMVFPLYHADELQDILRNRAKLALAPNCIKDSLINTIARTTTQDYRGNARFAITWLLASAELAARRGNKNIDKQDIDDALAQVEVSLIKQSLTGFTGDTLFLLQTLVTLDEQAFKSCLDPDKFIAKHHKSAEVYALYKKVCEAFECKPKSEKWLRELIGELDGAGLVNTSLSYLGKGKGRSLFIALSSPHTVVKEAVKVKLGEGL